LASVTLLVLRTENLKNLSSQELPLALIIRIFKLVKHVLEESVAYSLIITIIIYNNLKLDETKLLILKYI
jgi:hypothetical protein